MVDSVNGKMYGNRKQAIKVAESLGLQFGWSQDIHGSMRFYVVETPDWRETLGEHLAKGIDPDFLVKWMGFTPMQLTAAGVVMA